MQKKTAKKVASIKVKCIPNTDATSAKLVLDENGEDIIQVIKSNSFDYYQFNVNNDQLGISKFGKSWRLVPSKINGETNHNWYTEKLAWCIKIGGSLRVNQLPTYLNKFIKRTGLNLFK